MGVYDNLDLNNEDDQKRILRIIGKVKADTIVASPSSFARDMNMPMKIILWLEDNHAYFVLGVEIE
jgi:hypothetical protein